MSQGGALPSPAAQAANTDVYITRALDTRAAAPIDSLQEKLALQALAARMADDPEAILPGLVDFALELTGAVTGGLSLYEESPAPGVFRWHCLRGTLVAFDGGLTPRHYSPCGVTLDQRAPVLAQHPERIYDWLADAGICLPEVLLVPLYVGGTAPLGTLWVVSQRTGHFQREHARVLTELASFVGIALRMVRSEQSVRRALDEQEMLTREMNHRVQNLFALTNSLVRMSARGCSSASELADVLLGRLGALQRAHGLVRSQFTSPQTAATGSDLAGLVGALVQPHEGLPGQARACITGVPIQCGQRAVTPLALIFHELATNAAKYGALSAENGRVAIDWRRDGKDLLLRWTERGGPAVGAAPSTAGFGTTMVTKSVAQLDGTLEYHWQREGLALQMRIPMRALAD